MNVYSDNGGVDFVVTYERVLFIVLCNDDEVPAGNSNINYALVQ